MVLYDAYREGRENPLKPLGVQYADFALWQRSWLEGGALEEGLKYWKEQLAEIHELTPFVIFLGHYNSSYALTHDL
jgi:hypothetical protein